MPRRRKSDPATPRPQRVRCAECGTRTATQRLALYPDKPNVITSPLCDPCAHGLSNLHAGAKEVPL